MQEFDVDEGGEAAPGIDGMWVLVAPYFSLNPPPCSIPAQCDTTKMEHPSTLPLAWGLARGVTPTCVPLIATAAFSVGS